jgi:LPS O-antigen subunit length determinant protein (WzzB/FepE family)
LLESEKQKAMLANVNEDFALEVIDPAVAPVIRDKPNRKLIVVLGVVYGMLLSTFVVILVQIIKKFKLSNSPESSSL